ncbi:MAG TPA: hypothetical protein VFS05_15515 [Gemmatimonadaceae bacterium]|nr:hypothetical protein [Gemmatimonadaceae bacterium]
MRARLGRYALWQLRDYALERGLPTLVVAALFFLPFAIAVRDRTGVETPAETAALAVAALAETFKTLAFVIVLLGVNGMIAGDRKGGAFRFLFARPLSAPRYYAQAFAVSGAGALAATAIILAGYALAVHPVWTPGALVFVALYWVLLGGLLFLASALTRLDWVVATGVWIVAQVVRDLVPAGGSWYGALIDALLPPAHLMSPIGAALVGEGVLPRTLPLPHGGAIDSTAALLWVVSWGAGALLLGLLILRQRPIAT